MSMRTKREKAFKEAEKYKKKDQAKERRRVNGPDKRSSRMRSQRIAAFCGARKTDGSGETCKMAAGWGTPHPGTGSCKYHGGCVPTHVQAAAGEAANAEYRQLLGTPREMNPFEAIMWCIKIRAGEVQWLSEKMAELDEDAWVEDTLVGKQFHLYARERKAAMVDLTRFSQIAIQMGIAERYVRLAEVYGQTIAKLIEGILGDLGLTEEQRALAPRAIHRNLLLIEGGTDVVAETGGKAPQLPPALSRDEGEAA